MDFTGWQHADVISAIAMAISALAFLVSLAAAAFTYEQTRLAREKRKEERSAWEPIIDPTLTEMLWPGWLRLSLFMRNRDATTLVCESIRIVSPKGIKIVTPKVAYQNKRDKWGGFIVPDTPPLIAELTPETSLGSSINPAGTNVHMGMGAMHANDSIHVECLVAIPAPLAAKLETAASRRSQMLRLSLSVRRNNASSSIHNIDIRIAIPRRTTETVKPSARDIT